MTQNTAEDSALMAELRRCETAIWEALVSGNMAQDAAALHASFLGVYPDGLAGKDDHARQLASGPTVGRYKMDQERVMELGPDYALLSYRATYSRPARTKEDVMYVSSIWKRNGTGWINVFSQDTPAGGPDG
ncbi:nuclear transport factor 2 family protein [uncultured Roseobacter sp.]|uniref:nuclear transport factor 2 family protein n=1 Tax=uncultured Roseobacter sp. TaxID=114847 RepID=UPI0026376C46|nr:nuclear transport factor 2 family protein [uncultured Roseobacter sp.]